MTTYQQGQFVGAYRDVSATSPVVYRDDKSLLNTILMRLQMWISSEFANLSSVLLNDSNNQQYVRISKTTPHPILLTQSSVEIICRVSDNRLLDIQVRGYNTQMIKEMKASFDDESQYANLKSILSTLNTQQTSICKGIPEEKLLNWATGKNVGQILIEKFLTKIVFRSRNCGYVMLESDAADICRGCANLLSAGTMALAKEESYECSHLDCDRVFKYKAALDKHVLNHVLVMEKVEAKNEDDAAYRVKLEPELTVREYKREYASDGEDAGDAGCENGQCDKQENDVNGDHFMSRLLDELDHPAVKKRGRKIGSVNSKFKDYKCSDCNKEFIYHKTLLKHCVERHGMSMEDVPPRIKKLKKAILNPDGSVRKITCDVCGDTFKFKSGLYNHKKRMHFDTEKKQCPHCPRLVKSSFFDQHLKQEHSTPRFTCSWCGKGFYYQSLMLEHQRIHTGDFKQCICDLCGAAYKNLKVLRRHVNNAHQDIRSFQCTHCDKAFHTKQRLERHINSHTKAKHFQCPVCHIRSDRKDNLRTHIRKNHGTVINAETVELLPITGEEPEVSIKHTRVTPIVSSSLLIKHQLTSETEGASYNQTRTPSRSFPQGISLSHSMNMKSLLLPNVSLKPPDMPSISSRSSSIEGHIGDSIPMKMSPPHQLSPIMSQHHLQMQHQTFSTLHHSQQTQIHPGQIFAQKSSL